MNRRSMLMSAAAATAAVLAGGWFMRRRNVAALAPEAAAPSGGMRNRRFGRTDLNVSEVGFGSWAIGGQGYGAVDRQDSLRALARAEELGCNFVDTALVYGESEQVLGEFLEGRRSRWIIATKYSGQPEGMTATVEKQLRNLRTDVIDFYQVHWVPRGKDAGLFDELARLRQAGKIRYVGVSLYTADDIDAMLAREDIDGFQVAFNLLEPDPFLSRIESIREHRKGVIVRSALREGFLTGKFKPDATFPDPNDQRHQWSREQIAHTVALVERFRFLEADAGSMVAAAARYPLSFPEVSTVIMGTKSVAQAESNFGTAPGGVLSAANLAQIRALQIELGLGDRWTRWLRRMGLKY